MQNNISQEENKVTTLNHICTKVYFGTYMVKRRHFILLRFLKVKYRDLNMIWMHMKLKKKLIVRRAWNVKWEPLA